jgi:uncharacterized OsmC-like protein
MALTVAFRGGTKFEISTDRHTIISDQPTEDGGTDAGMGPVELFVGALAGCVGYFVSRYCARHGISCEGLTIRAGWSMAERPHRVGAVDLQIVLPALLDAATQEKLLKVAHGCTLHQTLALPPKVAIEIVPSLAPSTS